MGNPRGVKRDFEALEQRRLTAAALLQSGLSQTAVARRLRVGRASTNRWARRLAQAGPVGLSKAGRAGRKPQLAAVDLAVLKVALKHRPAEFGYKFGSWSPAEIGGLIEELSGVRYHPAHVWRIMRRLGWSYPCPVRRGRALNLGFANAVAAGGLERHDLEPQDHGARARPSAARLDGQARSLSWRRQRFIAEYLKDRNGTQAALRAGYARSSAAVQASRLLCLPHVRRELRARDTRSLRDGRAERVLQEIAYIAFLDPIDFFDDKGNSLPLPEIPENARRALAKVQVLELYDGNGHLTETVARGFRDAPKMPALEMLWRRLPQPDPDDPDDTKQSLEELRLLLEIWDELAAMKAERPTT